MHRPLYMIEHLHISDKRGSGLFLVWGTRHGRPLAGCGARSLGGFHSPPFPFSRGGEGKKTTFKLHNQETISGIGSAPRKSSISMHKVT